jgi:hypothetical protein
VTPDHAAADQSNPASSRCWHVRMQLPRTPVGHSRQASQLCRRSSEPIAATEAQLHSLRPSRNAAAKRRLPAPSPSKHRPERRRVTDMTAHKSVGQAPPQPRKPWRRAAARKLARRPEAAPSPPTPKARDPSAISSTTEAVAKACVSETLRHPPLHRYQPDNPTIRRGERVSRMTSC